MSEKYDEMDVAELRSRIVEAASQLYEKKGREATAEEIAKIAGISVPVTHQFVKKPADIMLLIMENLQHEFANRLRPVLDSGEDPERKLIQAITSYYQVVFEHSPKVMLVYRASRTLDKKGRRRIMQLETEAVDIFQDLLDQGVRAGLFKVNDTRLAAYDILIMGHLWTLKSWHFKTRGLDIDRFIQSQIDLILPMLRG